MLVEMLSVGYLATNCYIIGCEATRRGAIVDPGGDADAIVELVRQLRLQVDYVVDTHGHFDHVLANREVKDATGARLAIHVLDAPGLTSQPPELAMWFGAELPPCPPDILLCDGDELRVGDIALQVVHTPGHTPGHISLVAPGAAFVGDTLFFQGVGRTDLEGGDPTQLMRSIRDRLFALPDDTVVYCGHGPTTTIGQEKNSNPFVIP